jgi:hypothetical protein
MKTRLHIERLVLDGLEVNSLTATPLRMAVEKELAHLLTHGGISHELSGGIALPSLKATMVVTASNRPHDLGREIARAIYGDLGTKGTERPAPRARRSLRGITL